MTEILVDPKKITDLQLADHLAILFSVLRQLGFSETEKRKIADEVYEIFKSKRGY